MQVQHIGIKPVCAVTNQHLSGKEKNWQGEELQHKLIRSIIPKYMLFKQAISLIIL